MTRRRGPIGRPARPGGGGSPPAGARSCLRVVLGALLACVAAGLLACAGKQPGDLGVADARLAPCPPSPNCVSSDAGDDAHRVAALAVVGNPADFFRAARDAVARLPRTRIVAETPEYLHAECRSALFRFVDDLELHLRARDGVVAVRSASRLGHSDLGVNRRRVEALRAALATRGGAPR